MPEAPTAPVPTTPPASPAAPLPPPTALRGREESPERDTGEVLDALRRGKDVTPKEGTKALEWFLSEDPEEVEESQHTIELNVGVGEEQWIAWTVRPVDADELRRVQRQASAMRRRANQEDLAVDMLANLRIVLAGTVDPDLQAVADQTGQDPIAMLRKRFRKKPGLVTQIANKIMALSGFDDEDVRDALAAKN